eukprot:TRINITY_DN21324_c0_g1_i1.p1 TRINITY_DN21324_c0_g1~~TRINITY_DN21324_c0_g1_i1.p1  ORF type:complete len:342 (-),score=80.18 TRINITY_DN21324_c0_g1_i1:66-1016(-)
MKSSPEAMFDPEVIAEMRRQFQEADTDGDGEIDAAEACLLFARSSASGSSEEEIKRTADGLRNQMDADRSGTISFNEYCFRFGRKFQMELNRRRREGQASPPAQAASSCPADADELRRAREELDREREALRQEKERLQLEKEREALRREREALERERQAAAGQASSPSQGATSSLPIGSQVRIQGLQAAPELNGRTARVLRFEASSSRYVVELEGDGQQKSLRRESLVQVASSSSSGPGFVQKAKAAVGKGCTWLQARLAVLLTQYEWWQLLLCAAVVVLVVGAWLENRARYGAMDHTARGARRSTAGGAAYLAVS